MDFLPPQKRTPVLLAVSIVLAIALGFLVFSPGQALVLIRHCGYWVMAVTVVLFAISLVRFLRRRWTETRARSVDWVLWSTVAASTLLLVIHEPFGFKVLMDELVLAATSMSFHLHREVFTPLQTHNFDGAFVTLGGIVDKRPYFFPFLVSLLHDLTGYRPGNVFALNVALTFAFLALVGSFASRLVNPWAGRLAVLLLAGLPLLALNATGGGFEILNLAMIVLTMTAAASYLQDREARSLNLLVLSAVLLAQTRYESVLYLFPVGFVVLLVWIQERKMQITWPVIAAPLLLVPYPLLNSIINAFEGFWQLPEEVSRPFGPEFLADNLSHAVAYFFDFTPLQSNSVLLSLVGLIGLLFVCMLAARALLRRQSLRTEVAMLMVFGAVVVVTFTLLMLYHWGQLDQFVVSRLSLPLYLLFALAVPVALSDFHPPRKVWAVASMVAAGFALGLAIPSAARAFSTETFMSFRHTRWVGEFVKDRRDDGAYFIIPSPLVAVVHRQAAITNSLAATRARQLEYHLQRGTYTDAYVVQIFDENLETGELTPRDDSRIGDAFVMETVAERKFVPLYRSRISRITGVRADYEGADQDDPLALIRRELIQASEEGQVEGPLSEFFRMLP